MALRTPVSYAITTLKASPEILDVAQIYWFASRIQSATIGAAASRDEYDYLAGCERRNKSFK